jgi:hypothetical protein
LNTKRYNRQWRRKAVLLAGLYTSQALGLAFVTTTVPVILRQSGAGLDKISLVFVLGLPNRLSKEGLYFKGENGFRIGPDGSRVLLYRKTPKEKRPSENRAAPGLKCVSGNQGIHPGKPTRSFVRNRNCVFQPINQERTPS